MNAPTGANGCPTVVETAMTVPTLEDRAFRDSVLPATALGRIGRLHDVMGVTVPLADKASALVTGSALMVDGGWTWA